MGGTGWPLGGMNATAAVFGTTPDRGGAGGQGFGGQGGTGPGGQRGGGAAKPGGRWSLYDEQYVLSGKGVFNAKAPQTWLQELRDYLAGRSVCLDNVLDLAERQTSEIAAVRNQGAGDFLMFDQCPVDP